jgi:hypothetical protein
MRKKNQLKVFLPQRGAPISRKLTGPGMRRSRGSAIKITSGSLLVGDMGDPMFRKRG